MPEPIPMNRFEPNLGVDREAEEEEECDCWPWWWLLVAAAAGAAAGGGLGYYAGQRKKANELEAGDAFDDEF